MGLDQPSQKPAERRVIVCQKDSRHHGTYDLCSSYPGVFCRQNTGNTLLAGAKSRY
jgi:hypothetical protein